MRPIYKNLYQFSAYIPPMDFTIHQYLLNGDPAILFATGTMQQAETILPSIQKILNDKPLKYIFVSHLESDECGGLPVFQRAYPQAIVLCSALCARELSGFGYAGEMQPVSSEQEFCDGCLSLQFVEYPAEVHLQDGLVCMEQNTGIFYSSDLMLRFGDGRGKIEKVSWDCEVSAIDAKRIPSPSKAQLLRISLKKIRPAFIAVGHGYCLKCGKAIP